MSKDKTPDKEPDVPAAVRSPESLAGMNAQELAAALSPAELSELKAACKYREEAVVDGRCPGVKGLHVKADTREEAVGLVCQYFDCEPQHVSVSLAKRKSQPKRGDLVLRSCPVPGGGGKTTFIYGVE